MTLNKFILDNRQLFDNLSQLIFDKCKRFDDIILRPRWYWELGNTLCAIYRNCHAMNISKLTTEMIELFTTEYSKNYFPELMHVSMMEYERFYIDQYAEVLALIELINQPQVRIFDVGCGVAHMGIALNKHIDLYVGYDRDRAIQDTNEALQDMLKIESTNMKWICESPLRFSSSDIYEVYLFYHVFKHMEELELDQWLQYLTKQKPERVIIFDQAPTIHRLLMKLEWLGVNCKCSGNYLFVYKDESSWSSDGSENVSTL